MPTALFCAAPNISQRSNIMASGIMCNQDVNTHAWLRCVIFVCYPLAARPFFDWLPTTLEVHF